MKKAAGVLFFIIIFSFPILFFVSRRGEVSLSERRYLAPAPQISLDGVISGAYFDELCAYLTDNAPFRDALRTVKALTEMRALGIKENNSLAFQRGHVAKIIGKINDASIKNALAVWKKVDETCLNNCSKKYIAIIPDKGYFFSRDLGYPGADRRCAIEKVTRALADFEYIDVLDKISLDDYYKTDTHISQNRAMGLVGALCEKMSAPKSRFEHKVLSAGKFFGVYRGQSALPLPPDELKYIDSDALALCTVYDCAAKKYIPMYDTSAARGRDGYEMFLGGARGILKITNPALGSGREIVVFRDSFGSAVCPLLCERYDSVTAIDLRYTDVDTVVQNVNFSGKDVLFLYSFHTLENSFQMK